MNGYYLFGLIVALVLFVVTLIMIPIQYRYIKAMDEERRKNVSQGKMFEDMPVQEQVLHHNAQSNPLFIPANIIAHILYKMKKMQNKGGGKG